MNPKFEDLVQGEPYGTIITTADTLLNQFKNHTKTNKSYQDRYKSIVEFIESKTAEESQPIKQSFQKFLLQPNASMEFTTITAESLLLEMTHFKNLGDINENSALNAVINLMKQHYKSKEIDYIVRNYYKYKFETYEKLENGKIEEAIEHQIKQQLYTAIYWIVEQIDNRHYRSASSFERYVENQKDRGKKRAKIYRDEKNQFWTVALEICRPIFLDTYFPREKSHTAQEISLRRKLERQINLKNPSDPYKKICSYSTRTLKDKIIKPLQKENKKSAI